MNFGELQSDEPLNVGGWSDYVDGVVDIYDIRFILFRMHKAI